jgi:hypothetical protein
LIVATFEQTIGALPSLEEPDRAPSLATIRRAWEVDRDARRDTRVNWIDLDSQQIRSGA